MSTTWRRRLLKSRWSRNGRELVWKKIVASSKAFAERYGFPVYDYTRMGEDEVVPNDHERDP